VKTIQDPKTKKQAEFWKKKKEACLKDIERAFGALQAEFAIVCGLAHFFGTRKVSLTS
jgi:hypothetical protein